MQKYKITKINTGYKRDIHYRMENSMWCEILDLRKDSSALIRYKMVGGIEKVAHTSTVKEIEYGDNGEITIYTLNTVYMLEELNGIAH